MIKEYQILRKMPSQTASPSTRDWNFYQKVANRVVKLAAEDYQRALCDKYNCNVQFISRSCTYNNKLTNTETYIRELEDFFCGDWFMVLTDLDGPALMNELKNECVEYGYDYKKLSKAHLLFKEHDEDDILD